MEHLQWIDEPGPLEHPVLVVAFEGWNDAGDAASTAATQLRDRFDAEKIAEIDPEPFYDFSETRPMIELDEGGRQIVWPANELWLARRFDGHRDLLVLTGIEPQLRWRTFCGLVTGMAAELGVELVVSLGALIAEVAHSRPTTIYGASDDDELCLRYDLTPSSYEGPTGIVGVLLDATIRAGFDSVSLWATVPTYVPHAPNPKAALALLERLAELLTVPMTMTALEIAAASYERQVSELVEDDDETREYVATLEQAYDEQLRAGDGDELISELEQFLRDQDG